MSKKDDKKDILFYKIVNSSVICIQEEEAQKYFKDGVYFTTGSQVTEIFDDYDVIDNDGETIRVDKILSNKEITTYIFDFEKNSILPEVRFIDTYVKQGRSIGMFEFIIIGILAVGFIGYFVFQNGQNTEETPSLLETITNPLAQQPITVVSENSSTGITSENTSTGEVVPQAQMIVSSGPDILTQGQINNLSIDILGKTYTIKELNLRNANLEVSNAILSQDLQSAKDEAKKYLSESLEWKEQFEIQKGKNIEFDQLKLYLGNTVFDLCEQQDDSAKCKQVIYNFYKERQGE